MGRLKIFISILIIFNIVFAILNKNLSASLGWACTLLYFIQE